MILYDYHKRLWNYELKEYKEDSIPNNLKNEANVNYDDEYFKNQLNSYISN